ncbi:TonB-dependent receptor [Sphingomonas prati]|uniref:Outer membrane receptor protein involved in Fe transport n=1 Tax=Sphingomonas prati TaxID=1843237 RepID=A0A7W9BRH0_9SPHN|nr:TonB-dependent receptor [Sphingomonas prati]MBB5728781.1 outer membrane receptor protein involved in Fe transport [Sphingomonas prati]GGE87594.1 TonB-dependent receptor [Sphingomonas prati]
MTSEFDIRRRALRTGAASAALCLAMVSAPAFAQAGSPTSQDNGLSAVPTGSATASPSDSDAGAIVVTGSRIARRDLSSSSPLTVVSSEEFKLSGAVNVESVINTLPQVVPGTTSFSNNPGGGVATLNLRALGAARTLVLVNGRRYMFYDTSQITDLNVIPSFLLEGVDVVTGGASAVYGSDAIAGVVNFRLRNNLNGIEIGSQYSLTEQGDGARWDSHIAMGTDFADGRGHITAYAEYYKRKAVFQGDRDFSRFAQQDGASGLVVGGSATIPAGRFAAAGTQAVAAGNGLGAVTLNRAAGTNYTGNGAIFATPGTSRAYQTTDAYNFAPVNYLQVPQERFLTGAYGEYEVNDHVTGYMEVSFANNRVVNALAATPVTGTFDVNIANSSQYLSAADIAQLNQIDANEAAINAANVARGRTGALPGAGVVSLTINRRVTETGSRIQEDERNAFRTLIGVKGDLSDKLNYDAYYSYARTRNSQVQNGNISRSAFAAGVLDGSVNPFGEGTISGDALDSITILSQNNDISVLQVASGSLSGSLFNLGMGGQDVGFAVGGEYRSVNSRFIPDTALSSGDVIGFNAGQPTSGGYNVKEAFAELNVPLVADQPFVRLLELHGAARYSDYSLEAVGGVFTYAGDVKWSPIRDILFRATYQKAIRAPNVGELFGGQQQGFPNATDPCAVAGAQNDAAINATCIATGVPAGLVGSATLQPNTQIQGSFGGNPDLSEERSTSYTFGTVISPTFIPRLNISVDYFNVKVDNVVSAAGGGVASILDLCYNTLQDGNSAICQLIQRNPDTGIIDGAGNADGTFNVVAATNANLASLKTSGIDLAVDYTQPLGFSVTGRGESKLNFSFIGTWTEKNDTKLIAELPDTIECAGRFGLNCGEPQAKFKWSSRLSLIDGPFTLSGRWRHVGSVRDDDDGVDYVVENLKAYNQYDLTVAFDVSDQFSLAGGVNNILDKTPPIIGSNAQQANTYPGTYDVLGRDFFISANFRF